MNRDIFRYCVFAALLLITGVLQPHIHASSETEIIAAEIENLAPAVRAIEDEFERDGTLGLMTTALARMGKFETALQINNTVPNAESKRKNCDEIWRITARRLAWQGNIAAATRSANRIQSEYSRADAQLALARAYLRTSEFAAAQRLLIRAAPMVRATQSRRAISYLAYLFSRVGDLKSSRELFAAAQSMEIPGERTFPGQAKYDYEYIAFYLAKSGETEKALALSGGDNRKLFPVKAVLTLRQQWQPLIGIAQKLPTVQAVDSLLELTAAQLKAGGRRAASASWQMAKARFGELDQKEHESQSGIHLQVVIALLQVAQGDEAGGRAYFAELSKLPNFNAEHEFVFHYFLIVPLDRDFSFQRTTPKARLDDERAAISALLRVARFKSRFFNFLNIARFQQKRGDIVAMRETLQLARADVRAELISPQEQSATLKSRRYNAASALMQIAKIQRDAGEEQAARSTLAQAMTLLESWPRGEIASLLLSSGFLPEAGEILEEITNQPLSKLLDRISNGTLQTLGPRYAAKAGANAALQWILKIPNPSLRAMTLSGVAVALNPLPHEESELILRGDKESGVRVSARIRIPGYGSTLNFDEFTN